MVIITLPALNEEFTLPPLLRARQQGMAENQIEHRMLSVLRMNSETLKQRFVRRLGDG